MIEAIINAIADMNGTIEGAAAAIKEAFLQIPDAVSAGMEAAINAVITAVESMVNGVLDGVCKGAQAVDSVTGAAAGLYGGSGTSLAGGINPVTLPRLPKISINLSSGSVGDAYNSRFEKGRGAVLDTVESVTGFFEGVGETYERNRAELEQINIEAERVPGGVTPPSRASSSGSGGGASGGKKGGRKGRAGREERPFFEVIEKDLLNLERQMQLIGKTSEEAATARARWELLDKAKRRGIPVNETLNAQIDAQAAQVGRLTGELERAEISQQQFDQAIDGVADAMANALVAGESLRDGLAQVFAGIASDILNSGIRNALSGQFGGGGGIGGLLGGLSGGGVRGNDALSQALRGTGAFGGFRAAGGPVDPNRAYVVGEKGPEIIVPRNAGHVIPNHKLGAA